MDKWRKNADGSVPFVAFRGMMAGQISGHDVLALQVRYVAEPTSEAEPDALQVGMTVNDARKMVAALEEAIAHIEAHPMRRQ